MDASAFELDEEEHVVAPRVACTNSIFPAETPIRPRRLTLVRYETDDAEKLRG